jgi:two-component system cell cycle sensor histidine kinase/response regulator CckA
MMGRENTDDEPGSDVVRLKNRLRVISEVTRRFAEVTTDYRKLLDSVASGLAEHIRDTCVVFLLDEGDELLSAVAMHAIDAPVLEQLRGSFSERKLVVAEQVALRHVLTTKQALLVPRLGERARESAEGRRWQDLGLHSVLIVPLQVQGRAIGALTLSRYRPESPSFEASDLELAQNLADHAGLAIDNARLFAEAAAARLLAERANEAARRSEEVRRLERDESEQRLHRTLDSMKEGYTIMSRELRYLYVNRAGAEQTHLAREQLLGRTPLELYPGFEGSSIHLALKRAAELGEQQRVEEEFQHADGELGYFDLNIQPVPEGLVVLSIDQTERRRAEKRRDSLEEQLRQAQKMEAVGRLAGGIAHDFNNVLSVILGYAEELACEMQPENPQLEDVHEIQSAAARAAQLTKQLLMFSRQQVVEPIVLDLNVVLASMNRMLGRVLGEGVDLAILPGQGLGRVRADRSNIEQVIMNLTVNARDAMPNGGRLTIETSNVLVDEAFVRQHLGSEPGPYVVLAVTDSGVGMDQATRARIFEPFFSTKALGKGTGLGLSTVFGIVQQCGGGVWVYSELGRGTTFKIYLPQVDAEPDAVPPSKPALELSGTETVLLVEDEAPVRQVARRILERLGYQVLIPDSPQEAASLCKSHAGPIHLLVTDVVMPHVSGPKLAAELAGLRPGLKLLFMSGYTDGSIDAHVVIERGAAFLQKPFSSELLARKVRSVLDGSEAS